MAGDLTSSARISAIVGFIGAKGGTFYQLASLWSFPESTRLCLGTMVIILVCRRLGGDVEQEEGPADDVAEESTG